MGLAAVDRDVLELRVRVIRRKPTAAGRAVLWSLPDPAGMLHVVDE
jgi:hypothetical protein